MRDKRISKGSTILHKKACVLTTNCTRPGEVGLPKKKEKKKRKNFVYPLPHPPPAKYELGVGGGGVGGGNCMHLCVAGLRDNSFHFFLGPVQIPDDHAVGFGFSLKQWGF